MLGRENPAAWGHEALGRPRRAPWAVLHSDQTLRCWPSAWANWAIASFTASGALVPQAEGQAVSAAKSGSGQGTGGFPSPRGRR